MLFSCEIFNSIRARLGCLCKTETVEKVDSEKFKDA